MYIIKVEKANRLLVEYAGFRISGEKMDFVFSRMSRYDLGTIKLSIPWVFFGFIATTARI